MAKANVDQTRSVIPPSQGSLLASYIIAKELTHKDDILPVSNPKWNLIHPSII